MCIWMNEVHLMKIQLFCLLLFLPSLIVFLYWIRFWYMWPHIPNLLQSNLWLHLYYLIGLTYILEGLNMVFCLYVPKHSNQPKMPMPCILLKISFFFWIHHLYFHCTKNFHSEFCYSVLNVVVSTYALVILKLV